MHATRRRVVVVVPVVVPVRTFEVAAARAQRVAARLAISLCHNFLPFAPTDGARRKWSPDRRSGVWPDQRPFRRVVAHTFV